jgi:hypothetical protein
MYRENMQRSSVRKVSRWVQGGLSELNTTDSGKELNSDFTFLNADNKLSDERIADLFGRAKLGDIDGLALEAQITRKEALRFVRGVSSAEASASPRKATVLSTMRNALKTSDARRLARDLFAIFAKEAASKFAKNRFLFLNPSMDEEELRTRYGMYLFGKEIFDDLNASRKLSELRKLLSNLSFAEQATKTKKGKPSNSDTSESDAVRYFSPRRKMIQLADSLLTQFGDFGKLTSFLLESEGVQDARSTLSESTDALKEILKNLGEVDTLRMPDPEAILSDSELAINDEMQLSRQQFPHEPNAKCYKTSSSFSGGEPIGKTVAGSEVLYDFRARRNGIPICHSALYL